MGAGDGLAAKNTCCSPEDPNFLPSMHKVDHEAQCQKTGTQLAAMAKYLHHGFQTRYLKSAATPVPGIYYLHLAPTRTAHTRYRDIIAGKTSIHKIFQKYMYF